MYSIKILRKAAKELRKIDRQYQGRIAEAIDALERDPRPHGCKKMQGYESRYRIRVGDYRVIYDIEDEQVVVVVLRIRHRKDAYR